MNVKELIAELQKMPPDRTVYMEFCSPMNIEQHLVECVENFESKHPHVKLTWTY